MAQNRHALALPTTETGNNRMVFRIEPIARQGREIVNKRIDEIIAMRPIGVARHLRLLPRVEIFIELFNLLADLALKLVDFLNQIDTLLRFADIAQFTNLAFQRGNGFFKFQISLGHGHS